MYLPSGPRSHRSLQSMIHSGAADGLVVRARHREASAAGPMFSFWWRPTVRMIIESRSRHKKTVAKDWSACVDQILGGVPADQ